jgi:hypothetical protein
MTVIAAEEVEMSSRKAPVTPDRPPSEAEHAMAANARSRVRQGTAEDKALREHESAMTGDSAEHQDLGQPGHPTAHTRHGKVEKAFRSSVAPEGRSISDARQDASAEERAVDEGMGEPPIRSRAPNARP